MRGRAARFYPPRLRCWSGEGLGFSLIVVAKNPSHALSSFDESIPVRRFLEFCRYHLTTPGRKALPSG